MAHPPMPGPPVQPNFLAVMEAVADVTFPISKRDLLEQVGEDTVLFQGKNLALHDLVSEIHDDLFATEAEFLDALETHFTSPNDEDTPAVGTAPARGDSAWVATERAGPVESGRAAMVRSDSNAEDSR